MEKVLTAELYSCIVNKTGCTLDEVTDFLNSEIDYWNLDGSLFIDEDGEETYDTDKLYDYLCDHTSFSEEKIEEMLNSQYDVTNNLVPLDQKYIVSHNMIQKMKESNLWEKEKVFYEGCLEYCQAAYQEILKENHLDDDQNIFLQNYMHSNGYYLNSSGYWIKEVS